MKRYLKLPVAVLAALVVLTGCQSIGDALFGETTDDQQLAWRKVAGYVYVGVPVRNYVTNPNALEGIRKALCNFDEAMYVAVKQARAAVEAGGDDLTVTLASLNGALASINLEVFWSLEVPDDPGDVAARSVVWLQVGTQSAVEMRLWRRNYVKVKIEQFTQEDRAPTPEEWDQVVGKATDTHGQIQDQCVQPT